MSPDVPFCCSENGWTWPGVASCLWSLAPSLAPTIVSNANVRRARSRHRCLRASPRQRSSRPRHRPAPRDGVPAVTPGCAMTPRLAREAVTVGQIARRCARLACSRRPPAHSARRPWSTLYGVGPTRQGITRSMPYCGRCVSVCLCTDLHISNRCHDRQISLVARIETRLPSLCEQVANRPRG